MASLRAELESAIEAAIAALDALDGDADLEPECWDEGAQCDDEGVRPDDEPGDDGRCSWRDEGDQTVLEVAWVEPPWPRPGLRSAA